MRRLQKVVLATAVVAMAGCSMAGNHQEYKKALNQSIQKIADDRAGGDGVCTRITIPGFEFGQMNAAYQCQKQTPEGYDFSVAKDMSKGDQKDLDNLTKAGYIKFGSPYVCQYREKQIFGPPKMKSAQMVPVKILDRDDARFVHHDIVVTLFGDKANVGSLCVGKVTVDKIVSVTDPHFNPKYSMKTVAITANAGLQGASRLAKVEGKSVLEKHSFAISAILGKEGGGKWKVLKVTNLSPVSSPS